MTDYSRTRCPVEDGFTFKLDGSTEVMMPLKYAVGSTTGSPVHDLLTRKEAAYLLRLRPNTLAVWAVKRRYDKELPVLRLGRNLIRCRRSDLERFIAQHTGTLPDAVG